MMNIYESLLVVTISSIVVGLVAPACQSQDATCTEAKAMMTGFLGMKEMNYSVLGTPAVPSPSCQQGVAKCSSDELRDVFVHFITYSYTDIYSLLSESDQKKIQECTNTSEALEEGLKFFDQAIRNKDGHPDSFCAFFRIILNCGQDHLQSYEKSTLQAYFTLKDKTNEISNRANSGITCMLEFDPYSDQTTPSNAGPVTQGWTTATLWITSIVLYQTALSQT